jgi:hypothetical protein
MVLGPFRYGAIGSFEIFRLGVAKWGGKTRSNTAEEIDSSNNHNSNLSHFRYLGNRAPLSILVQTKGVHLVRKDGPE